MNFRLLLAIWGICAITATSTTEHPRPLYDLRLNTTATHQRNETAVLRNRGTPAEELVVKGRFVTTHTIPNDSEHVYESVFSYTADKNGFQVNYTLSIKTQVVTKRLGPIALKIAGG